jgi:outer membrane protein OmpA-like peptidoglycan-associated protein
MKILTTLTSMSLAGVLLISGCATNTGKGAIIGGASGAALGAAAGAIIGNQQANQSEGRAKGALLGAALGGAVGSGVGLGVGAYLDKQKREMEQAGILAQKQEDNTLLVTLAGDTLKFDSAKSTLKPEGEASLGKLADILKKYPENRIIVEGHTDNVGKKADNQLLSEQRANTVKNTFLAKGVPASNVLSSVGFGDSQPVSANTSEAGRSQNRRVVLKISVDESVNKKK